MDTIKITIETNAQDAAKSFETLANSFNDTDTQAQDLRKDIKDLKNEIYKMTPGTKEYTQALVQLGEKMNTLGDIQADIKASSGDMADVFRTTTNTLSNMAAGMQSAMGVVALFGGDTADLQKQFVQLQAVMSIVNGLKGFAGLAKSAGQAKDAIVAYIAKITLSTSATAADTVAKEANTVATTANATAQKAAGAAGGVAAGGLKAAGGAAAGAGAAFAAANPYILAVVAALAALGGGYYAGWRQLKNLSEATESYNAIMSDEISISNDVAAQNAYQDKQMQDLAEEYKKYGMSQEHINEAMIKYNNQKIEELRLQAQDVQAKVNSVNWFNKLWKNTSKMKEELKQLEDETNRYKESNEALMKAGDPFAEYKKNMEDFSKSMDLLIAEGLKSAEDKYQGQIKLAESRIAGLKKGAVRRHRDLTEKEQLEIEQLQKDIADYNYQIELLHAGNRKKAREEAQKTAKEYKDSFEEMSATITASMENFIDDAETEFNKIKNLDIDAETKGANVFIAMQKLIQGLEEEGNGVQEEVDKLRKQLEGMKDKLTKKAYKQLEEMINNIVPSYKAKLKELADGITASIGLKPDSLKEEDFKAMTDMFNSVTDWMVDAVNKFYTNTANLDAAFKNGQIDANTYVDALMKNVNEVNGTIADAVKRIPDTVEETIANIPGFSSMGEGDQNKIREFLTKYLEQALYIPDSEITKVINNAVKALGIKVDDYVKGFESVLKQKEEEYIAQHGHEPTFLEKLFGVEESAGFEERLRAQVKYMMNVATTEYETQKASIEASMKQLEDQGLTDTDEYKKYVEQLKKLYDAYKKYIGDATKDVDDSIEGQIKEIANKVSATATAIGNFAGAIADYYDDMAENEAKNSKEKQKYVIKGLQMQKFQTIANIASGIAGAIAGAMQLGMPMGPIVAAIESAAVAAAGAVQIKQINRQIKEAGGSGGGSDTPDAAGLMDRIIVGDTQNADQKDQLNAQYNADAMGETKVYVAQNEITDAQNVSRTAVTQNTF